MKTTKEKLETMHALTAWLKSQNVSVRDGTIMCSMVAGMGVGRFAKDEDHLERGIKIMTDLMRKTAKQFMNEQREKKNE